LFLLNEALVLQSFNEGAAITIFLWGESENTILFVKVLLAFNVDELEPAI
jgi:hypothetical protein